MAKVKKSYVADFYRANIFLSFATILSAAVTILILLYFNYWLAQKPPDIASKPTLLAPFISVTTGLIWLVLILLFRISCLIPRKPIGLVLGQVSFLVGLILSASLLFHLSNLDRAMLTQGIFGERVIQSGYLAIWSIWIVGMLDFIFLILWFIHSGQYKQRNNQEKDQGI